MKIHNELMSLLLALLIIGVGVYLRIIDGSAGVFAFLSIFAVLAIPIIFASIFDKLKHNKY